MKKYILLLFMGLGISFFVHSQEDLVKTKIPTLNNHPFISLGYLGSSFINTNLQASMGIGITNPITIPGITIDGVELFAFEGQILFFDLNIQYQQRFTDWLALHGSLKTAGRIGTDLSTIVVDGVNTISGGDIGWLMRISHGNKYNLSGDISVHHMSGNFINVSKYVEDILNNVPNPTIISKVPTMSVSMGLRFAYAFNQTIGLQASANLSFGESLERQNSSGYFSGGVVFDANFNPKYQVPIGVSMGYSATTLASIIMNSGGISNLFVGRLAYTGASDFELGVQFNIYNVYLKSVEDQTIVKKAQLILKFYF